MVLALTLAGGIPGIAADCNGNGRDDSLDLLPREFAFPGPTEIRLEEGNAAFEPLVVADLDRDGDPDLATLKRTDPPRVFLIENRGGGVFVPKGEIPLEWSPQSLVAADLDGDGAPELIVGDQTLRVLLCRNRGDGTFEDPRPLSAGQDPSCLAAGDLDGDGRVDLVVGNRGRWDTTALEYVEGGVRVLWNHPGGLEDGGLIDGVFQPWALAVGDVDADGNSDLLVADDWWSRRPDRGLWFIRGRGAGSFDPPERMTTDCRYSSFAIRDLDGDGSPEVAAAGMDVMVFARRAGTFEPVDRIALGWTGGVEASDIDRDGILDLVAWGPALGIANNRGKGDLSFERGHTLGPDVRGLAVADLDLDGDPDIAAITSTGTLFTLLDPGDGPLPLARNFPAEDDPEEFAVGDFDGDGDLDAAVTHDDYDGILIFPNDGSGSFGTPVEVRDPRIAPAGIAAADLDGDGRLDLVGNGAVLWTKSCIGPLAFGDAVVVSPGIAPGDPLAADFDRDGDADIISLGMTAAGDRYIPILYRNRGGGAFDPGAAIETPASAWKLLAADFDGKGWLDLLAISDSAGVAAVILGGLDGYLPPREIPLASPLAAAAAADLDLDGDVDAAVSFASWDPGPGRGSILANDGRGSLAAGRALEFPAPALSLDAGDLDGDGDFDLASSGYGDHFAVLIDRAGTFGESLSVLTGSDARIRMVDMDGDGILDILSLSETLEALVVHLNPVIPAESRDLDVDGIPDECQGSRFHRGDPDGNGEADISDPISILRLLFLGGPEPGCRESADSNGDGAVDLADAIHLLTWLFLAGPPPAPPGPPGTPCGHDPDPPGMPGHLGCDSYPAC